MKKIIFSNVKRGVNLFCLFLGLLIIVTGCNKEEDVVITITKEFSVTLTPAQMIPSLQNRAETGTATIKLMSDNSLECSISVEGLDANDQLTSAYICTGSPVETGDIIATLANNSSVSFTSGSLETSVNLTSNQANTINIMDSYIVIESTQKPEGLLRGQLGMNMIIAIDIELSPANVVPPVPGRNETGTAILRMTTDNHLYYVVEVNNLRDGDFLTKSGINEGCVNENGICLIELSKDQSDFGVSKKIQISTQEATCIQNDFLYVCVTSAQVPGGLLRGQIR